MRIVLAISALAASAVGAHAAEDRYGPPGVAAPSAATRPYAGPMLTWGGKTPAPAPQAAGPAAPARPEILAGGLYRPGALPAVPAARPSPAAWTAPPQAPQSLYDRAAPQAAGALPPPPGPAPAPAGLYAASPVRYYSVHRQYGEQPDPIPAPQPGPGLAWRPEASLAGATMNSGVGDGVRDDDDDDVGMGGVGAADAAEEAERDIERQAKRDAERAAARRAAAGGGR
jgi:hypothetical protein